MSGLSGQDTVGWFAVDAPFGCETVHNALLGVMAERTSPVVALRAGFGLSSIANAISIRMELASQLGVECGDVVLAPQEQSIGADRTAVFSVDFSLDAHGVDVWLISLFAKPGRLVFGTMGVVAGQRVTILGWVPLRSYVWMGDGQVVS